MKSSRERRAKGNEKSDKRGNLVNGSRDKGVSSRPVKHEIAARHCVSLAMTVRGEGYAFLWAIRSDGAKRSQTGLRGRVAGGSGRMQVWKLKGGKRRKSGYQRL